MKRMMVVAAMAVLALGGCATEGDDNEVLDTDESALYAPWPGTGTWACGPGGSYVCTGVGECLYNQPGMGGPADEEWIYVPVGTTLSSNEGVGNWLPYCGQPNAY